MLSTSSSRGQKAYTLFEIMLVLAIIAAATFGMVRFFHNDSAAAAVQQEQTGLSSIVNAVNGMYATQSSFAGISAAGLIGVHAPGVRVGSDGNVLQSAFGSPITLRPATVSVANDAFQVVYGGLSKQECVGLIPAVAGDAYAISIADGSSVVSKSTANLGQITDSSQVATQCAGTTFTKGAGVVVLTYYRTNRATAGPPAPGCSVSCAPQSQTQTLPCPMGQTGNVNQSRSGSCTAGACPTQVWSPWTTVSSSCAMTPTPPPPPVLPVEPPPPVGPGCTVTTYHRDQPCPTGFAGVIKEDQTSQCPSGALSPWTQVGNTCVAQPTVLCSDGSYARSLVCPSGMFGQIFQMQNYSCTPSGGKVTDGPWYTVSNNCATIGTCRPSTVPDGQRTIACSAGQFGQIIQDLKKSSTCPSPTSTPVWGLPFVVSSTGTCNACPAAVTQTNNPPCPTGYAGVIVQHRQVAYDCSASPTTLPAPTYGAWATVSNTCAIASCTPSGGGVWSVKVLSMATGPFTATPTSTYPIVTVGDSTLMKLAPTTARFLATGSVTFDMTVGAQTQQFTVACTQANSILNSPGYSTTDECEYIGTVTLNGVSLDVDVDACGLVTQDHVFGSAVWCTSKVTIDQAGCAPTTTRPGPVKNFVLGFWGGYWWHGIKPSVPSLGTCNAPVDGTNPVWGGSTGFNSWLLFNTTDFSADHYVVTMTRLGVTKVVTLPASSVTATGGTQVPQPNGLLYQYQSYAGFVNSPTVYALTPDIDWSRLAYQKAVANGGGGIVITPDFRAATVSIKACNSSGQCSAPTTQTDGISVFSNGERDCVALSGGTNPAWPPTAMQ